MFARHFIALIGTLATFASVSIVLSLALASLSAEPHGAPFSCGCCCVLPFCNCIAAAAFFPVSVIVEHGLRERLDWQGWKLHLVGALLLVVMGVGLTVLGGLLLTPWWYGGSWKEYLRFAAFFGGMPLLFGGPVYWFILCVSNSLVEDM